MWRFKNGLGVPDKTDLGLHPGIVLAGSLPEETNLIKRSREMFGTLEGATGSDGVIVNRP